ncbi:hypothetical protein [Vineibacter terrae]|uniref:hypothetical protein n=1 Tax=Vineibacter terrae TaxID=2586908 RepID=UPI002E33A7EC|nr:hypothetical protein [Vineibacter terrae]HEX2888884.1 hypothetical protein [Vineibacter terrae]
MTLVARAAWVLWVAGTLALDTAGAAMGQPKEADWPCVQVLQPELSVGAMWSGPDPAQAATTWRDMPAVMVLVQRVAPRRVPVDEATAEIRRFLAAVKDDRRGIATQIFAGLFDSLNTERGAIIRGIQRYGARQSLLAERIEAVRRELDGLDPKTTDAKVREQRADLEAQMTWRARIFDDREKLLPLVCEQPAVIERRLFALSRALSEELDKSGGN